MNESKELGRAKNLIRNVQCSGFVRVEQQVCLRPPWRLTAQIRSIWIPMASKAAAQIRQGSVGLGQRQEEEKERRWDIARPKKRQKGGRKSTEAGGQTTKCSGRPSLSKGGTHAATGPVIIIVIRKVGSTAFSATSRGRKSTNACGVGMGGTVSPQP